MNEASMPSPQEREAALFALAVEKPVAERAAFLQAVCGNDNALRQRLDALLAAHEQPADLLGDDVAAATVKATIKLDLADAPDEAVGQTLGRYKLLEQIGEGGCGVVYVAEQKEPVRRKVALKVIKLGMDTKQVVARFEAERQALAMMDHPNIAKVLDAGTTDVGRPYFVMELVRGIRITDYCDQANLSTKERLDLFIKVCHAIQHAHQKGIIHRDIKPSNILVTLHDGVPVPKVIDFGIAKATQGELTDKTIHTQFQQFIGTPAYMSPEQAEMSGLDIDTRSDIYSLGVLLYELLAGSTPFDAKELMASGIDVMRKTIRDKEPQRPSTRLATLGAADQTTTAKRRSADTSKLLHQLKGDLDWIVMKCLEKDRQRRYDTANGLAADLKRHLENEPVTARPPSVAYRFQKALRRNKLAFGAGAAVVAALVVGLAAAAVGWRQTGIERDKALQAQQRAETSQRSEQEQRQRAETERRRAEKGEADSRAMLYAANINLAQQAWDQNNGTRLRQLLEETKESANRNFEWYYWQRQAHLELKTLRGHLASVISAAFSPDGQRIVTGSADNSAKVWDSASGKELLTLKGHGSEVRSVAFSPDGQRIVTGSQDNSGKVWDSASGKELLNLKGHGSVVRSVAFSPDGQRIVTGSEDQTAKVWDSASGKELLTLKGHGSEVRSVAFSPDGQRIVTGSQDNSGKVWDSASGKELLTLKGHGSQVLSVAFSPDGQRIVTGSRDQTAKVWDSASVKELLTLRGNGSGGLSVAFSPDGQRIVTGSGDQTAKVWNSASGKELLTLKGHGSLVRSVAFSPDGQRIVTGSEDQTAKVWDSASGKELLTLRGHGSEVRSVAFSQDGQRIVTGSVDNSAKVWDSASGKELLTLKGHGSEVWSVAFSPDGQRIVTGSRDNSAKVWDSASGKELLTLKGHGREVRSVAFSLDGQRIVTGSGDQTAKVWDTASGKELLTLKGHGGWVWSVAFSPDGQRIVTGSGDQTAKVWDTASGKELLTLRGHGSPVESVAFSPDGQRVVTGSADNSAKVWESASPNQVAAWQAEEHAAEQRLAQLRAAKASEKPESQQP